MKNIFISHASTDAPIVQSLIDDLLVGSLSVKVSDIFCTTTDGMKIESGEDWRNCIQKAIINSKVTILIVTPNYKESEVCICEMGAAWMSSAKILPFVVEPINYSSVGIIQQPKQVEKLLDEKSLDRLKDVIQDSLKIDPKEIRSDRWTAKKYEFMQKTRKHIEDNPFHKPMCRDEFQKTLQDKKELESAIKSLISEKIEREEFIEELKRAKDKKEFKEIEKKYNKISSYDEFVSICKNISGNLSNLSSIIRGIVFISYSGKDIRIQHEGWQTEIDEAISRDYLTEDLDVNWDATKLMRTISNGLDKLSKFLEDAEMDEDKEFIREYEEKHEAPHALANIDFWRDVFNLNISIS